MATPTRVQRFLDYVAANDIDNAEIAIVRELVGVPGRSFKSFIEQVINGYDVEEFQASHADPYYYAILTDAEIPAFELSNKNGYPLTHAILYAADFGRKPLTSSAAITRVLNTMVDEDNMDLLGEYLMCLVALSEPLPVPQLNAFNSYYDREWTEYNHTLAVGALLYAMINA